MSLHYPEPSSLDNSPEPSPVAFSGSTVSFHAISLEVNVRKFPWSCPVKLRVLKDLSGFMTPGMNAIMGPTGCGKSSFLDVLTGQKDPDLMSGCVLLNGKRLSSNRHRRLCGYVVQENIAFNTLTVRENITFSAALRLPKHFTSSDRATKVDKVIDELELTSVADRILGTEYIRGVSGGERKRTCIGIELIKDPLVLYLDEPTTGLDAHTAGSVMKTLRRLADKGRTIVFSIHQPKYSIYRLFDRLTLLADGEVIYHGASGLAPIDYFDGLGYTREGFNNPADFILDTIHGEVPCSLDSQDDEVKQEGRRAPAEHVGARRNTIVDRLAEQWRQSELHQTIPTTTFIFHSLVYCLKDISRHLSMNPCAESEGDEARLPTKPNSRKFSFRGPLSRVSRSSTSRLSVAPWYSPLDTTTHCSHDVVGQPASSPDLRFAIPSRPRTDLSATTNSVDSSQFCCCCCSTKKTSCCRLIQDSPFAAPFYKQVYLLSQRQYLSSIRDYRTLSVHFLVQFVVATFLGVIYFDLDHSLESGIQNRIGLFFLTSVHLLFINSSLIDTFIRDRLLFRHETSAGLYRVSAYFFSKIISEILTVKALPAALFLPITYVMAGLRLEWRPFLFWEFTLVLLTICASAIAFSVSTMVTDARFGGMLMSMFSVLMMITSGFLINVLSLGQWARWLRYFSILRFAISILSINEMSGMQFCPRGTPAFDGTRAGESNNSSLLSADTLNVTESLGVSSLSTFSHLAFFSTDSGNSSGGSVPDSLCIYGEQYLETQSIDYSSEWAIWRNESGIFGVLVLALINAYLYLRLMKRYK